MVESKAPISPKRDPRATPDPYSRPVQFSVRGFLMARFIAMVAWFVWLVVGFQTYEALKRHLAEGPERWVASVATLVGTIWLGLTIQQRVLQRLDPDGELRRRVRE